ncbi:MAG: sigma-70 family RNA polymerase sigma factor [Gemmatimonadales bacterium]|nr:sigma-70 family RNA polymerase sigma factor [Gemmatimonadales bacterium]
MAETDVTAPTAVSAGMSEDALLRGLREAVPEAASELCRRFAPKLHRFAAARLGWDTHLAEDIAIQALAAGVRSIRRFNPRKATLTTWLYGIAYRKIVGEQRRRGRLKSAPASAQVPLDEARDRPSEEDPAERMLRRLEAQQQVAEVAAVLSDIEFEVLTLHCLDELSAREIGRIVGRSERAIHSLLHRARKKARGRLMDDEDR